MLPFRKLDNQSKASVLFIISFGWLFLSIPISIFSTVGFTKLSIKIPIGWTPPIYPDQCEKLEKMSIGKARYIIEPGFPFRYERSVDMSLDTKAPARLCGDHSTIVISSNRIAAILNWAAFILPLFILATSMFYIISVMVVELFGQS